MKSLILFIFFIMNSGITVLASDHTKVIYDEDNRLDLIDHPLTTFKQIGASVATQIETKRLSLNNGTYTVQGQTLTQMGICAKERFSHQNSAARCSGFLIAPDLLVTAGQCIQHQDDCQNLLWVFDYFLASTNDTHVRFSEDKIFRCSKIIARSFDASTKENYAVIRLDRPALGRFPLKFRKTGVLPDDSPLFTIGSSLGLPLKITDQGKILDNTSEKFFLSNLDTYIGGAGSPVINQNTLDVEGIYVSGEKDLVFNPELNCSESKRCTEKECSGERVTRITVLGNLSKGR